MSLPLRSPATPSPRSSTCSPAAFPSMPQSLTVETNRRLRPCQRFEGDRLLIDDCDAVLVPLATEEGPDLAPQRTQRRRPAGNLNADQPIPDNVPVERHADLGADFLIASL